MDLITLRGLICFKKILVSTLVETEEIDFSQFMLLVQTTVVYNETF